MALKIDNKFKVGQLVFLIADNDQLERQVIGIVVTPLGLMYVLTCNGEGTTEHYEIEISETKNVI